MLKRNNLPIMQTIFAFKLKNLFGPRFARQTSSLTHKNKIVNPPSDYGRKYTKTKLKAII